mgnify:CR=1 FL=1
MKGLIRFGVILVSIMVTQHVAQLAVDSFLEKN